MTAQPLERTDLDTDLFEALDFDPPCEGRQHGKDSLLHDSSATAWALVAYTVECGCSVERWLCKRYIAWIQGGGRGYCGQCGALGVAAHGLHIIARVRP